MALEVINAQYFCKAISKYTGTIDLFYLYFLVGNKLTNIIILHINVFNFCLALSVLYKDNTSLIVSVK